MEFLISGAGLILVLFGSMIIGLSLASQSLNHIDYYLLGFGPIAIGLAYFSSVIFDYRAGWRFVVGVLLIGTAAMIAGFDYSMFVQNKVSVAYVILGFSATILVLGVILLRRGHRHHRIRNQQLIEERAATDSTLNNSTKDSQTAYFFMPPFPGWQIFILLCLSFNLYSIVLTYRLVKDLVRFSGKHLNPKAYATAIVLPIIGIIIFYSMARTTFHQAKTLGVDFKLKPSWLSSLMVATTLSMYLIPNFLFPAHLLVATLPWLFLNRQLNELKRAHPKIKNKKQRLFKWPEYGVILLGIPLMGAVLYGSRINYLHQLTNTVPAGQYVQGVTPIYRLQIGSGNWRKMPLGTLDSDTDLELMGKSPMDWIVVRAFSKQQLDLDTMVANRRELISSSWKNYHYTESRTLNSGAKLTPISLASYTRDKQLIAPPESVYVATIITPETVVEVVGYSANQRDKDQKFRVKAIVDSLRLVNRD